MGRIRAALVVTAVTAVTAFSVTAVATAATAGTRAGGCPTHQQPLDVGSGTTLTGVASVAACSAWAVGNTIKDAQSQTLIEHWNGSSWRKVAAPNPGGAQNYLYGVSAVSAKDIWAVGASASQAHWTTLVLHWNGSKWRRVPSPNPGKRRQSVLNAVWAVSATDAWAVGYYYHGTSKSLIEHWNGSKWSTVRSPNPRHAVAGTLLESVAASSPGLVWAVGYSCNGSAVCSSVILRLNGSTWKLSRNPALPSGENGYLYGVTALSARSAWAAGYLTTASSQEAMIEHWNGTKWKLLTLTLPSDASTSLTAVRAFSAHSVIAVGDEAPFTPGANTTFGLHWNGSSWNPIPVTSPFGSSDGYNLLAVSGASCSSAWVVGSAYVPPGFDHQPISTSC
jgi:hypothetical protein